MISKKVIRYYADGCKKAFWKKQACLHHEKVCKCWKNPKNKACLTCNKHSVVHDSNGMEDEPQYLDTWKWNDCSDNIDIDSMYWNQKNKDVDVNFNCQMWEQKV